MLGILIVGLQTLHPGLNLGMHTLFLGCDEGHDLITLGTDVMMVEIKSHRYQCTFHNCTELPRSLADISMAGVCAWDTRAMRHAKAGKTLSSTPFPSSLSKTLQDEDPQIVKFKRNLREAVDIPRLDASVYIHLNILLTLDQIIHVQKYHLEFRPSAVQETP